MVSADCEGISIGPMNTLTNCEQHITTIKIDIKKERKIEREKAKATCG